LVFLVDHLPPQGLFLLLHLQSRYHLHQISFASGKRLLARALVAVAVGEQALLHQRQNCKVETGDQGGILMTKYEHGLLRIWLRSTCSLVFQD
jgi:hypothetical protein